MNELNFNSDIKESCTNIKHDIIIQDTSLHLELNAYNNKELSIDILKKWQSCFALLGKGQFFQSKDASAIIYCLLSDASTIENINNGKVTIDLYDHVLKRFYLVESLTKKHRNIRLKIFPICKTIIVIDWLKFPIYKVYELYNTDEIKEYYESKKVNFDTIIKDINLQPKFIGKVDSLPDDFKKLSVDNFNIKDYKERHIAILEDFLKKSRNLERKIQFEYKKSFNLSTKRKPIIFKVKTY
jgi:hypothetical protein